MENLTKEQALEKIKEALEKIKELELYIKEGKESKESKDIDLLGEKVEYLNPKHNEGHRILEYKNLALIWVGKGLAPYELKSKCLALNPCFNWEIKEYGGGKLLIPTLNDPTTLYCSR